ncbi:PhzF family phenazine biosynthesis protein [Schumannella luteola]
MTDVLRMTAFPAPEEWSDGVPLRERGNPAGVVLDARGLSADQMTAIAADLGYSESAFVIPTDDGFAVRYFTPDFEIPFCGHATIATAVALANLSGPGELVLDTPVGPIELVTELTDGAITATFTSVEPWVRAMDSDTLAGLLLVLGLEEADLDPRYPPRESFAGNVHPVIAVSDAVRFDDVDYDPAAVRRFMDDHGWVATVTLVHARDASTFETRNIFPVGDIREDPATGAAAASVGAWLRDLGAVPDSRHIVIHQGRHVGRPSLLRVRIPETGGIAVTGTAAAI